MTSIARFGLCFVLLAGAGACSSSSKSSNPTTTTTSSPAAPAAASVALLLTGGVGLTGAATQEGVRCNEPDLDGSSIAVLADAPDSSLLMRIAVTSGRVKIIVSSGSDAGYHERAFAGTGVTFFDAARRASLDSTLTESATAPGSTKGDIGVLAAIKGTIDCGDQTPGSSTVTIAGDTAEGALTAAPLDPVRVECDASPQGTEISASGLTSAGATKVLVSIGLTSDGAVTVDVIAPSFSHRYVATGTATITATGGHVRADLVEQKAPSSARTLHAEGDLTCGRNAAG